MEDEDNKIWKQNKKKNTNLDLPVHTMYTVTQLHYTVILES